MGRPGTREEGPYQNTFGIRPRLARVQVANSDATYGLLSLVRCTRVRVLVSYAVQVREVFHESDMGLAIIGINTGPERGQSGTAFFSNRRLNFETGNV